MKKEFKMDKNVFKDISYGLYIVSSIDKEKDQDVGCVINTLNQLTSTNPLVAICLNKENYTNEIIKKEKRFVVSILSEEVNPDIIKKFGFSSSKAKDKFAGEKVIDVNGIKTLDDAAICSYIECEVSQIIDVGSHDLFIGKVVSTKKVSSKKPMSYKYYYELNDVYGVTRNLCL